MAKLDRKAYITFIDSSFGGTASWFKIGADLEEFTIDLNPEIEQKKNILGENCVTDKGYEVSASVEPYYANTTDAIYETIRDIALERKTGDACRTKILEVVVVDTTSASHLAFTEDIIIKPTSFGGGVDGLAIPFNIHFAGNRVKGTVAIAAQTGVPTFTADI